MRGSRGGNRDEGVIMDIFSCGLVNANCRLSSLQLSFVILYNMVRRASTLLCSIRFSSLAP